MSVFWLPVSCAITGVICYLLFGPAAPHALPAHLAKASDPGHPSGISTSPALIERSSTSLSSHNSSRQALRDGFQKGLAAIAGNEKADYLMQGMSHQPFGDFGKYDVVVTFEPNAEFIAAGLGGDSISVSYNYIESSSGAAMLSGSYTLEKFTEIFGKWSLPDGHISTPKENLAK